MNELFFKEVYFFIQNLKPSISNNIQIYLLFRILKIYLNKLVEKKNLLKYIFLFQIY